MGDVSAAVDSVVLRSARTDRRGAAFLSGGSGKMCYADSAARLHTIGAFFGFICTFAFVSHHIFFMCAVCCRDGGSFASVRLSCMAFIHDYRTVHASFLFLELHAVFYIHRILVDPHTNVLFVLHNLHRFMCVFLQSICLFCQSFRNVTIWLLTKTLFHSIITAQGFVVM